ncbi:serine/threonine-protein kinase PEPKR2-like isoform X1 [Diospyros lotus]|uniref:serine/threonine-protein kinase PEPKR2-like isoform X1 n=1 Tax=Diospyros lotus TaxID=55363 RepID=UPI00224F23B3|nr:serine/threonine-protein kinase PEPKR2-like isoform X1 [Diospyros lotus]
MEFLGKKRKGADILPSCRETTMPLTVIWSYFSLEDCSRQKKKCKEETVFESVGSHKLVVNGVVTAPPCGGMSSDTVARGLKRKIGCIDAATQLGRKKKIEEDYYLGAVIGQGKFGSVVLCQSKASGEEFACKTLCKGEEIVHREVEIMQHLSGHPGIVTLKSVYEDAESFYLVMELCPGGRLLDHMAREIWYSEQAAAKIIKELMLIIKYCHDMGVVHRDIKPENILLTTSGRIKLADFGLAVRVSNGQSLSGVVGSPAYVAPEVLVGNYSEKVDIWAAGVLLHALLVGKLPFQGDSLEAVFEAIKKVNLDFNTGTWESVSQPARDLIAHLLTRDLSARFTAEEVLSHPWILFYTEPTLKTLTSMPKMKNHVRLTSRQLTSIAGVGSERNKTVTNICLNDDSRLTFPSDNSTKMTEDEDEDFVDVLAMAISRVRISEPKRSRVCCPANPIQQECSSNMTVNNLCTAF